MSRHTNPRYILPLSCRRKNNDLFTTDIELCLKCKLGKCVYDRRIKAVPNAKA